jgi:hypothetical protein
MAKTLVVTGCDENHHELAIDLIASLEDRGFRGSQLAFIDLGAADPPEQLSRHFDLQMKQTPGPAKFSGITCCFLALKSRLPSLFPGFDTYIWLDADCWIQNTSAISDLIEAAQHADIAVHPELDIHYFRNKMPSSRTLTLYQNLYGDDMSRKLSRFPMVNCGVFSARCNSRLWREWAAAMEELRTRWQQGVDVWFSEQIPLHRLIYSGRISMFPLRAVNNWQLYVSVPLVDIERKRIVTPTPPHEEINIIHLAGRTKKERYRLRDVAMKSADHPRAEADVSFRYRDVRSLFAGV